MPNVQKPKRLRILARLLCAALLGVAAAPVAAGPPYATDDPEPTDPGHWEIYNFMGVEGVHRDWGGALGVDVNYGPVKDVQLTATLPLAFSHEGGVAGAGTRAGAGDVELGLKYRFLHAETVGFDAAFFPRMILPTAGRRFGTGKTAFLLPVWLQKKVGPWSVFGGGGYAINPGAGNRNYWQTGIAITRAVSDRLTVGGEATWDGPGQVGGHPVLGFGLGGIYKLTGPFALLVSGGPVHERHGPTGWRAYVALGLSY